MCLEAAAAVNRIFKTMRSTPARRRRKALPAESLRGKGPRVRRWAAGRARLSRWAWPRDIGSIMLTPIRKPTLTRGRYAYHLRQHDRQCVSANVIYSSGDPIKNLVVCLLCFLEPTECHVGQNCFGYSTSSELTILVTFSILPRRS